MVDLTVLTCNIPGRDEYLVRNMASVREQSVKVKSHIVIADDGSLGTVAKYNQAFMAVQTEWVSILDDDNYWFADHVATIAPYFDQADVIYTWDAGNTRPRQQLSGKSPEELAWFFDGNNTLDQSCAIRSSFFEQADGFHPSYLMGRAMDQDLWRRIAELGGRFLAIPKETWFYQSR